MEKLTEEQIDTLKYFWQYNRDLERYCDFEKLKPQIKEQLPCLYKAWEDYKEVIQRLDILTENM